MSENEIMEIFNRLRDQISFISRDCKKTKEIVEDSDFYVKSKKVLIRIIQLEKENRLLREDIQILKTDMKDMKYVYNENMDYFHKIINKLNNRKG